MIWNRQPEPLPPDYSAYLAALKSIYERSKK